MIEYWLVCSWWLDMRRVRCCWLVGDCECRFSCVLYNCLYNG